MDYPDAMWGAGVDEEAWCFSVHWGVDKSISHIHMKYIRVKHPKYLTVQMMCCGRRVSGML